LPFFVFGSSGLDVEIGDNRDKNIPIVEDVWVSQIFSTPKSEEPNSFLRMENINFDKAKFL
jgi:hypothetical protein